MKKKGLKCAMAHKLKSVLKNFYTRKLFRYFTVIFLIPFLLITVIIFCNLFDSFSRQATFEQLNTLLRTMDHLQNWQDAFERVFAQLTGDPTLVREHLHLYSQQSALQGRLKLMTAVNNGLDSIWYYLPEEETFLSGSDSLSVERLNNSRFSSLTEDDGASGLTFFERLCEGEILAVHDNYVRRASLLYPYFIRPAGVSGDGQTMLVFELNLRALSAELESLLSGSEGMVRLRNARGATLFTYANQYEGEPYALAECVQPGTPYATGAHFEGSPFSGENTLCTSVASGAWAIDLVCVSHLLSRFQVMQSVMLLLLTMLLLGCCVCTALTLTFYRPIRSIRAHFPDRAVPSLQDSADDYEYIESNIERIHSDNRQLRLALQTHAEKSREFIATMLFSGRIRGPEELKSTYHFSSTLSESAQYAVLVADTSVFPMDRLSGLLPALHQSCFIQAGGPLRTVFGPNLSLPDGPACAGLCLVPTGNEWPHLPVFCAQGWFALAMGQSAFTPALYQQALTLCPSFEAAWLSALEAGSAQPLSAFADMLAPELLCDATHAFAACLLRYIAEKKDVVLDDASIFYLPGRPSVQECRKAWDALLFQSGMLLAQEEKEDDDPIEQMYHYIDRRFDSPDFSIKQMAGDFSMSISTLSSFFKSHAGILLSEYITQMKMKKAMHLLTLSNLSVQEVGLSIGYFNVNSFARRFHQVTGMTPREYRSAQAAEQATVDAPEEDE